MNKLDESLETCPIIKKGEYNYFVHPLADGVPEINPSLLAETATEVMDKMSTLLFDKFVTVEAMGIPLTTMLSYRIGKPFVVIRKREYGLPGEVKISQTTGYSKNELYINDVKPGDRVVLIDDVVSTGGTLLPILNVLKKIGVEIVDIIVLFEKGNGIKLLKKHGYNVKTLRKITITKNGILRSKK